MLNCVADTLKALMDTTVFGISESTPCGDHFGGVGIFALCKMMKVLWSRLDYFFLKGLSDLFGI